LGDQIKQKIRWAGHVARIGERRSAYSVVVDKPKGKITHARHRRMWENNIKIELQEVGRGMD
jgi:hypothetical protein